MIFDCFQFFNELELLEIRLHELSDVVDKFVLVEATRTHTGLRKSLWYEDNKLLFRNFYDKIIHVIVEDMPITPEEIQAFLSSEGEGWIQSDYQYGGNWVRERFQRNAIMRGLVNADPEDIVIIGDADEIIRATVVEQLKNTIGDDIMSVDLALYSGYINLRCTNMPWWSGKILKKKLITTPSEDRFHTLGTRGIQNGGWHFNFLGGVEAIKTKVMSYAHQEFNRQSVFENLEKQLAEGKDVFGRDYLYKVVPIDESYPKYILDNLDKFDHLIYKGKQ